MTVASLAIAATMTVLVLSVAGTEAARSTTSLLVLAGSCGIAWVASVALICGAERIAGIIYVGYGLIVILLGVATFAWFFLAVGYGVVGFGVVLALQPRTGATR
jgi:hypothetical protein